MAIERQQDRDRIVELAREGKQIAKIMEEDFPEYEYWEIYEVVYSEGGKSALGVKRTIANRLKKLRDSNLNDSEKEEIINEIDELVWHLYDSLKSSQAKLDAIRKIMNI